MSLDDEDGDDLSAARGIFGWALCVVLCLLLVGWLVGCAPARSHTQQAGIDAARVSLTAAETSALYYVRQPLCGSVHPKPQCSEAAISEEIKRAARYAKESIEAAQIADDAESLATANAAIAKLVASTPKPAS